MKVAITIEYFDPAKGGGETYARNFARALLAAGHEVHIFTNAWDSAEEGFIYHAVPKPPFKFFRRWHFARAAARLVRQESFDVVHGFGKSVYMDIFRPGGGVHRAWQEQELKAAGAGPQRWFAWLRQRLSLDHWLVLRLEARQFRADGPYVVAVSKMVREEILRFYRPTPERVRVIHNGVDLERFHPRNRERYRAALRAELGLGDDEVMLLFVGHNFKRKGLRPAIEALAALGDDAARARLVVLGGDSPRRYAHVARALGVADRLLYAGASRAAERFYAAADVLVFPSYYDPCANVVLEAMAAGLPVVTSIYNGSGELITPGREGYVVDPDDTAAMAAALRALLDADARAAAGRAARTTIEERPIARNVAEILELYDLVLAERAAGRDFRDWRGR